MANLYKVQVITTGVAGSPAYTNLYFREAGGTAQQAVDAVRALLNSTRVGQINTAVNNLPASVMLINESDGQAVGAASVTPGAPILGSVATGGAPNQVSAGLRLRTDTFRFGRRVQGRVFLPYVVLSNTTTSGPTTTAVPWSTINTAAQALVTDATSDWVVWARPNLPTRFGLGVSITLADLSPVWFTQRSRLV